MNTQFPLRYEYLRIYSSRHSRQNLWPHLVRTGSFDGRKHIMQWRSSSGGLTNCSSWPEGTARLFGISAIAKIANLVPRVFWRRQERCTNVDPQRGAYKSYKNYRIFQLIRIKVHYKNGRSLGRWAYLLILQNQFQKHLNSLLLISSKILARLLSYAYSCWFW